MIVAAVSRVSTWPSISRPASPTGIRGGEKATGIGRSGSLGTICASWPASGVVPGARPAYR